jgi:6-phosphofructo-2-kinase / fructose-2,6-biphosphatase 2
LKGLIGGNSDLSVRGKLYAEALANFIKEQNIEGLRVWTSWMKRTIQSVSEIKAPQERWKALNEIDAVNILFCITLR